MKSFDETDINTLRLGESEEDLETAAKIIADGGLVAFPTETVYGLGADALNPDAVADIYIVKGRPSDNPSIVHIADPEQIRDLTPRITEDMRKVMDAFWPGPMTMITEAKPIIPMVTTGGLNTVGIRLPDSRITRELIRRSGCYLAGPSANISGKPSPTTAQHVLDDFTGRIEAVIDAGPCRVGIESTVIDMTGEIPMILRPGGITKAMFEEVLGKKILLDPTLNKKPDPEKQADFKPKAPGQKYKHYAPDAEMILFEGDPDRVTAAIDEERNRRELAGEQVCVIDFRGSKQTAAHEIFARLRQADKDHVNVILAAAVPEEGLGFSVMNRLLKSAGYNIRRV